jgi:hypothetical protein
MKRTVKGRETTVHHQVGANLATSVTLSAPIEVSVCLYHYGCLEALCPMMAGVSVEQVCAITRQENVRVTPAMVGLRVTRAWG